MSGALTESAVCSGDGSGLGGADVDADAGDGCAERARSMLGGGRSAAGPSSSTVRTAAGRGCQSMDACQNLSLLGQTSRLANK